MIDTLVAARVLIADYSAALIELRTREGLSLRDLTVIVGIPASNISRIETGCWLPTEDEARRIGEWVAGCDTPPEILGHRMRESARSTDPDPSHETIESVAADRKMADRIVELAKRWYPSPFDDTDLTEAMNAETPGRPRQRNSVARARGLIGTELRKVKVDDPTFGTRWVTKRVTLPDCPLQRLGTSERLDRTPSRRTTHFVYVPVNERKSSE